VVPVLQHTCPLAPQVLVPWQRPPTQVSPGPQARVPQQGIAATPQVGRSEQNPPTQLAPVSHTEPAQQF
jgi:hypothetical protein